MGKTKIKVFGVTRKLGIVSTLAACVAIASYEVSVIPPVYLLIWLAVSIVISVFSGYYMEVLINRRWSKLHHENKIRIVDLDYEEVE